MAKFTAPVDLRLRLPGGFEVEGAAGATHRIPDSLVEEFIRDQVPGIPGGVTWITQDEMSGVATLPVAQADVSGLTSDLSGKYDKTGGIISGSVTATGSLNVGGSVIAAAVTATAGRFKGGPWHDVRAYGAAGDDVTDDSAAIAAAITAAGTGGIVFFPAGSYLLTSTLAPTDLQTLMGVGLGSVIRYTGSSAAIRIGHKTNTGSGGYENVHVTGIRIVGTSAALGGGIEVVAAQRVRLDHLSIESFSHSSSWAIRFDTASVSPYVASINGVVEACTIISCYNGLIFTKDAADPGSDGSNHNYVAAVRASAFTGIGLNVDAGEFITLVGCDISSNVASAIGVRINDNVVCVFGLRTDNSAAEPNGAIGLQVTSSASDALIFGAGIGNGPETRVDDQGPGTVIFRNAFTRVRHSFTEPLIAKRIGASVFNSASISINDSSTTRITFTAADYDTIVINGVSGAFWTSGTPDRLTIPTGGDGLYTIGCYIRWAANSVGYREVILRKNGTTVMCREKQPPVTSGSSTDMVFTFDAQLAAGDYVELLVQQTSGGALDSQSNSSTANRLSVRFQGT